MSADIQPTVLTVFLAAWLSRCKESVRITESEMTSARTELYRGARVVLTETTELGTRTVTGYRLELDRSL